MNRLITRCGIILWMSMVTSLSYGAVYKYTYTGEPMFIYTSQDDPTEVPYEIEGYSGYILIDEGALPGGTLIKTSASFTMSRCYNAPYCGPFDSLLDMIETPYGFFYNKSEIDGLLDFAIFDTYFEADFSFQTDEEKNIVSWKASFADGPPDGGIKSYSYGYGYDAYFAGSTLWYAINPGRWSAPVLVPEVSAGSMPLAIALLLFGGLAFSERRRSKLV